MTIYVAIPAYFALMGMSGNRVSGAASKVGVLSTKVTGNGSKLQVTLGIGSERAYGARACNRLDGGEAI